MGRFLSVNLSTGELKDELPEERFLKDFLGGYGVGARLLFSRLKPKIDPLGPENILGFVTGPLTGTPIPFGSRYTVVAKSPLTGTWGDANSGGDFGPYLRFAGYDAVFFAGVPERPVYLVIDDGKAELRDAGHLWGKDSDETEDLLIAEVGKDAHVACIGPAGEKLSLISAIMNNKGRAAARSGVGAVMGSKRLKAIAVRGNQPVPLADKERVGEIRKARLQGIRGPGGDRWRKFGTSSATARAVQSGDAPVKNWGGVGIRDFLNAQAISDVNVIKYNERNFACWRCPYACGAYLKAGEGEYRWEAGAHRPEYETLASFGSMCLNDNVESIIKANDICNRYGLDTISAGSSIAFAIECYENGIITKNDTGGIELTWGNHAAIVAMTEKMAKREGFGDVLADGVRAAAKRIGKGADRFAVHIQGQEPGMHDPRLLPGYATSYTMDATPSRHMQGGSHAVEMGRGIAELEIQPVERYVYTGKGEAHRKLSAFRHVVNAVGLCAFGIRNTDAPRVAEDLNAVTGWDLTVADLLEIGDRIATIRHAFNLREGLSAIQFNVPGRMVGKPPLEEGPLAGVEIDLSAQIEDYLKAMDWDLTTGKPSKRRLMGLGLEDVAEVLWP